MLRRLKWIIVGRPIVLVALLILVTSFLHTWVAVGQAQSPRRVQLCGGWISYDTPVTETIPYGGGCEYRFSGTMGQYVTVRLIKGYTSNLDPYLELINPVQMVEAFDDDSGGNSNSLISRHRLMRSGTYKIIATSYQQSGGGSFTLTLTGGR
ncbi:MAG: hypothetical protein KDF65_00105 [Anaerolineae bacterium]|nr:hypothetical protein [Anaerolineae bacterium]